MRDDAEILAHPFLEHLLGPALGGRRRGRHCQDQHCRDHVPHDSCASPPETVETNRGGFYRVAVEQ